MGDKKTTQETKSEPWGPAQPALLDVLGQAQGLQASGQGFQPFLQSLVPSLSSQTQSGLGALENKAQGILSNQGGGLDFLSGVYNSGGLTPLQQQTADQWGNTASGAELLNNSPQFEDVLNRVLRDARTGVDLSMSGAGRYGSPGAHQGALVDQLGGISSNARLGEYERQLGRQDTARANLAGLGQLGLSNVPGAYTAMQQPAMDLLKVGAANETQQGRELADQYRQFQETQQGPINSLNWLAQIGTGIGGMGGTTNSTMTQPGQNPLQTALGAGLGIGSLLFPPAAPFAAGASPFMGLSSPFVGVY